MYTDDDGRPVEAVKICCVHDVPVPEFGNVESYDRSSSRETPTSFFVSIVLGSALYPSK